MSEIINKAQDVSRVAAPPPTVSAMVREAHVSVTAHCSDDVPEKLNLLPENILARGEPERFTRTLLDLNLPILEFSEQLLYVDGYMAVRLLQALQEKTQKPWFIFGSFRSLNGKRYHIVLPREQVPQCFAVLDWEILDWTKNEIHKF